jgi:hypothetical protein
MEERMNETPKGKLSGRRVKDLIKDNKLSTPEKYNAFRKAHPKLNLPSPFEVMRNHAEMGWNW